MAGFGVLNSQGKGRETVKIWVELQRMYHKSGRAARQHSQVIRSQIQVPLSGFGSIPSFGDTSSSALGSLSWWLFEPVS